MDMRIELTGVRIGSCGVNFVSNFVNYVKSPHFERVEHEGNRSQRAFSPLVC